MNKDTPRVLAKEFNLLNGKKEGKYAARQGLGLREKVEGGIGIGNIEEEREVLGYCHSLFVKELKLII